jgi:hypothetical protein
MVQRETKVRENRDFSDFPDPDPGREPGCLPALFASHVYDMLLRLSSAPKLRGLGVDGGAGSAATRRDKRSVLGGAGAAVFCMSRVVRGA